MAIVFQSLKSIMPFYFPDLTLIEQAFALIEQNFGVGSPLGPSGLDLDARDVYGETALHAAAKMGLPLLCQTLACERPALLAELDNFNLTPLMLACLVGESTVVKALLPGSPLEARSLTGKTALLFAATCPTETASVAPGAVLSPGHDIMSMLLGAGADPFAQNFSKSTILHLACLTGAPACIELAIELLGARALEALDANGHSPLELAGDRLPLMAMAALEALSISGSCAPIRAAAKRSANAL